MKILLCWVSSADFLSFSNNSALLFRKFINSLYKKRKQRVVKFEYWFPEFVTMLGIADKTWDPTLMERYP